MGNRLPATLHLDVAQGAVGSGPPEANTAFSRVLREQIE